MKIAPSRSAKNSTALLKPKWLRIGGYWYPRGGMPIDVFWQAGKLPKGVWVPDQGVAPYRGRGLGRRSPPLHLQGAYPSCYGERDRSDEQHGIDPDAVQPKTVDDRTGRLAEEKKHGMSSGRRAARSWRQFRDVDLNATVQQVKSKAHDDKICKLDRPGHAQRDNDQTESHRHAACRHKPALTDIRQQPGNHESIDDAANAKSGNDHACD